MGINSLTGYHVKAYISTKLCPWLCCHFASRDFVIFYTSIVLNGVISSYQALTGITLVKCGCIILPIPHLGCPAESNTAKLKCRKRRGLFYSETCFFNLGLWLWRRVKSCNNEPSSVGLTLQHCLRFLNATVNALAQCKGLGVNTS